MTRIWWVRRGLCVFLSLNKPRRVRSFGKKKTKMTKSNTTTKLRVYGRILLGALGPHDMTTMDNTTFLDIPSDLYPSIFRWLPSTDLANICLVCKSFHAAVEDEGFFFNEVLLRYSLLLI
jgi:hypothetical protein